MTFFLSAAPKHVVGHRQRLRETRSVRAPHTKRKYIARPMTRRFNRFSFQSTLSSSDTMHYV